MVLRILIICIFCVPLYSQFILKKIELNGNKAFNSEELLNFLKSSDDDEFKFYLANSDKNSLINFYFSQGYINAEVSYELKNYEDSFQEKILIFNIRENKLYRFGKTLLTGNNSVPDSTLLNMFRGKENEAYQAEKIADWLQQIKNYYLEHGKLNINIKFDFETTKEDQFKRNLKLYITENRNVYFRDIYFKSINSDKIITKHSILESELEFKKNDLFNSKLMQETETYLFQTNIFQSVAIQNFSFVEQDSLTKINDSIDVFIELQEKKQNYAGIAVGLSTDYDQYYLTSAANSDNFFKKLTYDLNVDIGKRNWKGTGTDIGFGFRPVWFINNDGDLKSFSNKYRIYTNFLNIPFHRFYSNFELSILKLTHPVFGPLQRFQSNYTTTLKLNQTSNIDLFFLFDNNSFSENNSLIAEVKTKLGILGYNIYSAGLNYRIDHRDNFTNPKNGYLFSFNGKASQAQTQETGPTIDKRAVSYYSGSIDWRRYQPFPGIKRLTLANNFKLNAVLSFDHSQDSIQFLPKTDRLYSGNINRAFEFNRLGKLLQVENDSTIEYEPVGARALALFNTDLRYLTGKLFGFDLIVNGFVDITGFWQELNDININSVRIGYGFGVAWYLEVLLIRMDYGIKINRSQYEVDNPVLPVDYESSGNFNFGLSYHF